VRNTGVKVFLFLLVTVFTVTEARAFVLHEPDGANESDGVHVESGGTEGSIDAPVGLAEGDAGLIRELFEQPSRWTRQVKDNTIDLYMPVTEEFVRLFATYGGRVTTADIVSFTVYLEESPRVRYIGKGTEFNMLNGNRDGRYGTLYIRLPFSTWQERASAAVLNALEILGRNRRNYVEFFRGGVVLDSIRDRTDHSSSGGCNPGIGFLALLLLIPALVSPAKSSK
jgi:hypothetical protein